MLSRIKGLCSWVCFRWVHISVSKSKWERELKYNDTLWMILILPQDMDWNIYWQHGVLGGYTSLSESSSKWDSVRSSVYRSILLLMSFRFLFVLFLQFSYNQKKKCCKENSCSNVTVHMYKNFFKIVVLNPGYMMKWPREPLKNNTDIWVSFSKILN